MTKISMNGSSPQIRPASEFASGEPGIYAGVPAITYHTFPALSNSALVKFAKCPAALAWDRKHGVDPTSAMKKGSMTHALLLEPEAFLTEFVTADQCIAKTTKGTRCSKGGQVFQDGKWYCSQHADSERGSDEGRTVVSKEEYEAVLHMRDSIYSNTAAKKLLSLPSYRELSCLWIDEETGLLCKSRIDIWLYTLGIVVDIKTTGDASPEEFGRRVYNGKLYWQAAWYPYGLHANGHETKSWLWLACENSAPFVPQVYEADAEDIDRGWTQIRPLVRKYAECLKADRWGGYSDRIEKISMPTWAKNRIDDDITSIMVTT